jgi:hypothetical protein
MFTRDDGKTSFHIYRLSFYCNSRRIINEALAAAKWPQGSSVTFMEIFTGVKSQIVVGLFLRRPLYNAGFV